MSLLACIDIVFSSKIMWAIVDISTFKFHENTPEIFIIY